MFWPDGKQGIPGFFGFSWNSEVKVWLGRREGMHRGVFLFFFLLSGCGEMGGKGDREGFEVVRV